MKKTIIIVNGKGGSWKSTFIEKVMDKLKWGYDVKSTHFSTIEPIKDMLRRYGYLDGKSNEERRLLCVIKQLLIEHIDGPFIDSIKRIEDFKNDKESMFFFIEIREPSEIRKVCACYKNNPKIDLYTVLIRNDLTNEKWYGNSADDQTEEFNYDCIVDFTQDIDRFVEDKVYCDFINVFVEDLLVKEKLQEWYHTRTM